MVKIVEKTDEFVKTIKKIKDFASKEKIEKQVRKILENPEVGNPMMYARKGTRETYLAPFRISYAYVQAEDKVIFLDIYHKDEQ